MWNASFKDICVSRLVLDSRLGLRYIQQIAKFGEKQLIVRPFSAARSAPPLDEGDYLRVDRRITHLVDNYLRVT